MSNLDYVANYRFHHVICNQLYTVLQLSILLSTDNTDIRTKIKIFEVNSSKAILLLKNRLLTDIVSHNSLQTKQ